MKIAVLACGPSLVRHFDTREAFDLVIAVNTAGWLYRCDWQAFSDKMVIDPILSGEYECPRVGLLTNKGWKHAAEKLGIRWASLPLYDWRLNNLTPEMKQMAAQQGMTECGYTFPNALFFAKQLGATEVHVFGMDCSAKADVAGLDAYHTRKRWLTELPWTKQVWDERFIPRCEANGMILGWLSGLHSWEVVVDHFRVEGQP